jgi:hypothetical protein
VRPRCDITTVCPRFKTTWRDNCSTASLPGAHSESLSSKCERGASALSLSLSVTQAFRLLPRQLSCARCSAMAPPLLSSRIRIQNARRAAPSLSCLLLGDGLPPWLPSRPGPVDRPPLSTCFVFFHFKPPAVLLGAFVSAPSPSPRTAVLPHLPPRPECFSSLSTWKTDTVPSSSSSFSFL